MPYTQIMVDTNSYLRLAQNIHPLLGQPFGPEEYALYILSEVNTEFKNSSRLQNKFTWASLDEYTENRKKILRLNKNVKQGIEDTYEYMWYHVKTVLIPAREKIPSPTDTRMIATAAELQIEVVTDDQPMIALAQTFGVPHLTSLELLHRMLEREALSMERVEAIVSQWQYERDTPYSGWEVEYHELFSQVPPRP